MERQDLHRPHVAIRVAVSAHDLQHGGQRLPMAPPTAETHQCAALPQWLYPHWPTTHPSLPQRTLYPSEILVDMSHYLALRQPCSCCMPPLPIQQGPHINLPAQEPRIYRKPLFLSPAPWIIDTHTNHIANDISRNHLSSFFLKVPRAYPSPTHIPQELVHLLLNLYANSISLHLRQLFISTLNRASPLQPTRSTE